MVQRVYVVVYMCIYPIIYACLYVCAYVYSKKLLRSHIPFLIPRPNDPPCKPRCDRAIRRERLQRGAKRGHQTKMVISICISGSCLPCERHQTAESRQPTVTTDIIPEAITSRRHRNVKENTAVSFMHCALAKVPSCMLASGAIRSWQRSALRIGRKQLCYLRVLDCPARVY